MPLGQCCYGAVPPLPERFTERRRLATAGYVVAAWFASLLALPTLDEAQAARHADAGGLPSAIFGFGRRGHRSAIFGFGRRAMSLRHCVVVLSVLHLLSASGMTSGAAGGPHLAGTAAESSSYWL